MRSTPQVSRQEGSTTDGPGCDLTITGYYAAFVLDPDGNNVEAVFHGDH